MVLDGDIHIENLTLDGSLSIRTKEKKEVKDLVVNDKNYVEFQPIGDDETDTRLKMRGYKVVGLDKIKTL